MDSKRLRRPESNEFRKPARVWEAPAVKRIGTFGSLMRGNSGGFRDGGLTTMNLP